MRHLLPAARVCTLLAALGLAAVGCTRDDQIKRDHEKMNEQVTTRPMAADACTHCPGVQRATADGRCPACGMKV